jgi:hypothetical protein
MPSDLLICYNVVPIQYELALKSETIAIYNRMFMHLYNCLIEVAGQHHID